MLVPALFFDTAWWRWIPSGTRDCLPELPARDTGVDRRQMQEFPLGAGESLLYDAAINVNVIVLAVSTARRGPDSAC